MHGATDRPYACHCCGLVQTLGQVRSGQRARCSRCGSVIYDSVRRLRSNSRASSAALAALVLFPPAILLPIMRVERFGHSSDSSIWGGAVELLGHGELFVGFVVLICSIVLPLLKLLGILALTMGGARIDRHHRAATYRAVEWAGRWGMLDILLIAVVVAWVKIGDLVEVTPGPAAFTFTLVVLLSLFSTACFDPHAIWQDNPDKPTRNSA